MRKITSEVELAMSPRSVVIVDRFVDRVVPGSAAMQRQATQKSRGDAIMSPHERSERTAQQERSERTAQ